MYPPLLNCISALYTPLSDPLLYLHPIFLFVLLYCCGFSPSCFGTWKQSFISLSKTEEARLELKWLRLPGLTAINVDNHRLSCDKSLSECGFVCGNSHNLDHYLIHSFHVNFTYIYDSQDTYTYKDMVSTYEPDKLKVLPPESVGKLQAVCLDLLPTCKLVWTWSNPGGNPDLVSDHNFEPHPTVHFWLPPTFHGRIL